MATTWKKIAFTGGTDTNIATDNLTIANSVSRILKFGGTSAEFSVRNSSNQYLLRTSHTIAQLGGATTTHATLKNNTASLNVGDGGSNTWTFDDTDSVLIKRSTGTNGFPTLELFSNDSAPLDFKELGSVIFSGNNSAAEKVNYASVRGRIRDTTNGTDDGYIDLRVAKAGSETTAFSINGSSLDISTLMQGDTFQISSTADDAAVGPILDLRRNSVDPADDDVAGALRFTGETDTDQQITYAEFETTLLDVTNASPDGKIAMKVRRGSGGLHDAIVVKGTNLDLTQEMNASDFIIKSIESGNQPSPSLVLDRAHKVSDNEPIAEIDTKFLNSASAVKTASKIQTVLKDNTNTTEDSELTFDILEAGSQTEALKLTPKVSASQLVTDGATKTDRMRRLQSVEVGGENLSTLTERFLTNYSAGHTTAVSGSYGSVSTRVLRAGGLQSFINGSDFASSRGFIMPFDGYFKALTLGYRKAGGGNNAEVKLIVKKYSINHPSEDPMTLELVMSGSGEVNKSNPSKTAHFDIHAQGDLIDTRVAGENHFDRGDKVIMYVTVESLVNGQTYSVDDIFANLVVYHENGI